MFTILSTHLFISSGSAAILDSLAASWALAITDLHQLHWAARDDTDPLQAFAAAQAVQAAASPAAAPASSVSPAFSRPSFVSR